MTELIARIGPGGSVQLINEKSVQIEELMTPLDAAYLAKGLFSCAVALCHPEAPGPGTIVADAGLPITNWVITHSPYRAEDVILTFHFLPGVQLNFPVLKEDARKLGEELIRLAGPANPSTMRPGPVH